MCDWDAIVVGSGLTGGVVAKELAERGLKVLVLERGPKLLSLRRDEEDDGISGDIEGGYRESDYDVQRNCYAFKPNNRNLWVKDSDHPYKSPLDRPFSWFRGYHVGGRSLTWARLCYRWSCDDFEANAKDGHGVDWPIRYKDLAPWYDKIERLLGVTGSMENLSQVPDGIFAPSRDLNVAEIKLKHYLSKNHPGRTLIPARLASEEFSTITTTLPAALCTGNAVVLENQVVSSIVQDDRSGRVTGVYTVHAITKERSFFSARIIFVNASAIATAALLLSSRSEGNPNGIANRSGQVGKNLMDHVSAKSRISGYMHSTVRPRTYSPSEADIGYMPRYCNYPDDGEPFSRGFAFQVYSNPARMRSMGPQTPSGLLPVSQRWRITLDVFGEVLPYFDNHISLDFERLDTFGMPLVKIDASIRTNERQIVLRATEDAMAMLVAAGFDDVTVVKSAHVEATPMGDRIHEMGTARMGIDPSTSVLNRFNQAHDVQNLFISDGSCMASSGAQNPSLTYMALSARAAHYAADLLTVGRF